MYVENKLQGIEMNFIETSDFYLASYLQSQGIQLSDCYKVSGDRKVFVFEDNPKTNENIELFRKREAVVEPLTYAYAMKYIKSVMYGNVKYKDKNINGSKTTSDQLFRG